MISRLHKLAVIISFTTSATLVAQEYDVLDVTDSGAAAATAHCVLDDGTVLGTRTPLVDNLPDPFGSGLRRIDAYRRNPDGTYIILSEETLGTAGIALPSCPGASGRSIWNFYDSNLALAGAQGASAPHMKNFLVDAESITPLSLPFVAGEVSHQALTTNDSEIAVGVTTLRGGDKINNGFVYDIGTGQFTRVTVPGSSQTYLTAIDHNGVTYGFRSSSEKSNLALFGFSLRTPLALPDPIKGVLADGSGTFVLATNGTDVVGEVLVGKDANGQNLYHAARFNGGIIHDLGTFGGPQSRASGVSQVGEVVGNFSLPGTTGRTSVSLSAPTEQIKTHGFIWDNNQGMRDLNNLVDSKSGLVIVEANKISQSGKFIAATGLGSSGQGRALLLTRRDNSAIGPTPVATKIPSPTLATTVDAVFAGKAARSGAIRISNNSSATLSLTASAKGSSCVLGAFGSGPASINVKLASSFQGKITFKLIDKAGNIIASDTATFATTKKLKKRGKVPCPVVVKK